MSQEIERKFLLKGDFHNDVTNSTHIVQAYIPTENGSTVRIRIRNEKAYITIKGKSSNNGLSRYEWEKEISKEDATELLKLCINMVEKTRHLVPFGKHTFEVDEFHGLNEGLIIAEVELESETEEFERPAWLGKEVTGDKRYYNSHLGDSPYTTWDSTKQEHS